MPPFKWLIIKPCEKCVQSQIKPAAKLHPWTWDTAYSVHASKNGSPTWSGHLPIQQEMSIHWEKRWAREMLGKYEQTHNPHPPFHVRATPGDKPHFVPLSFLIPSSLFTSKTRSITHRTISSKEPEVEKVLSLQLFFTFSPTFSAGIFSSASPASVSHTIDQHT